VQNVDSDVDSDIDSNESEEDNINDVHVQKAVQVQKGVQIQNVAKNFHGKGKKKNNNPKKNKGGRKKLRGVCRWNVLRACDTMMIHDFVKYYY
jgi:hypothetical protein